MSWKNFLFDLQSCFFGMTAGVVVNVCRDFRRSIVPQAGYSVLGGE
jgi:hypothetical protein